MDKRAEAALDVLAAHGIKVPEELDSRVLEMPGIGRVEPNEVALPVTLDDIFGQGDIPIPGEEDREIDGRLGDWIEEIRGALASKAESMRGTLLGAELPEANCAWYQPMHFFGRQWGIYIREQCVMHEALAVAKWTDPAEIAALGLTFGEVLQRVLRAGFYTYFLHEQFHHKVESLGFRMLVTSSVDRYRPYKFNVYRPTYWAGDCLEESLANADSYLRLGEGRYSRKLGSPVRKALKRHLRASIPSQPSSYAKAMQYLTEAAFRDGCCTLQSQMLDSKLRPTTPIWHWHAAPNLIRAMMDFTAQIYVVLPTGWRPIFPTGHIDPRVTISTREMVEVLARHYGCAKVKGGKGSHIKLKGPKGESITLTSDLTALPGHEIRQAMRKFLGEDVTLRDLDLFRTGKAAPRAAPVSA